MHASGLAKELAERRRHEADQTHQQKIQERRAKLKAIREFAAPLIEAAESFEDECSDALWVFIRDNINPYSKVYDKVKLDIEISPKSLYAKERGKYTFTVDESCDGVRIEISQAAQVEPFRRDPKAISRLKTVEEAIAIMIDRTADMMR